MTLQRSVTTRVMRVRRAHVTVRLPWWESADWRRTDSELAAQYGFTRQAVCSMRRRRGIPASVHKNQQTGYAAIEAEVRAHGGRPARDIAAKLGVTEHRVKAAAGRLGVRLRSASKYPWHSISAEEWESMTNIEIAERLGASTSLVASWRSRNRLPRSPYRSPRGRS